MPCPTFIASACEGPPQELRVGTEIPLGRCGFTVKNCPCGAILGDQFRTVADSSSRMSELLIPAPKAVICSGWRSQQREGIPWMNCGLQNRRRVGSSVQVEDGDNSAPAAKLPA